MAKDEENPEDSNKDAQAEEAEGGEGAKKSKFKLDKKKIIILAGVLVLLIGGAAGAYFMGYIPVGSHAKDPKNAEAEGAKDPQQAENSQPVFYSLPEFLVNLNSTGKTSFVKMEISLELSSSEDVKAVEANLPRIQDSFNTYLRELRASDLSGSAGLYRLKEELLLRLNKNIAPHKVNDILFREILVQ